MNRLNEYLAYHRESARAGDIDPSHAMLRYICDRFELNVEQRYWLAFLYAMTYNGASVFYIYNEFPDFENVDLGRLQRWWDSRGRNEVMCTTDRRWVRSLNLFVPAVESYRKWVLYSNMHTNRWGQHEHFKSVTLLGCETPEARYNAIYKSASNLHSFGQFALFLYLEALHTITPLELCPTDLDLRQAHSCRSGLLYAYGCDEWIYEGDAPPPDGAWPFINTVWPDLRERLKEEGGNVWNIETTLCAYKKYHRGKRYLGYYVDRQALEIAKMARNVPKGVCWDVLWDFRAETYRDHSYLVEVYDDPKKLATRGLSPKWRDQRNTYTQEVLSGCAV